APRPDMPGPIGALFGLVLFAFFIGWIVLLIQGFQGKHFKLPVIGDFAEQQASGARVWPPSRPAATSEFTTRSCAHDPGVRAPGPQPARLWPAAAAAPLRRPAAVRDPGPPGRLRPAAGPGPPRLCPRPARLLPGADPGQTGGRGRG